MTDTASDLGSHGGYGNKHRAQGGVGLVCERHGGVADVGRYRIQHNHVVLQLCVDEALAEQAAAISPQPLKVVVRSNADPTKQAAVKNERQSRGARHAEGQG